MGVVDRRFGRAVCATRASFGQFDGSSFEAISLSFPLDHGPDFYAPALWAGTDDDEVIATAWTNSWACARLLPSGGWSGGAHALPRRWSAVRSGRMGYSLRRRPAALLVSDPPHPVTAARNEIGARALRSVFGRCTVRLEDLALGLHSDELELILECHADTRAAAGFAGRWSAPRHATRVHLLLDGCVAEIFTDDGAVWMSALTLRDGDQSIDADGDLAIEVRPIG